ncbi:MAG: aminotransferase class V-fold PLP-dependent enzyme [Natronospirillum sp.]|uniref:aminotransferase class V-fold PLP-dependent enzyme n=1 Tax=Natronospirillum sp. TaxID=2812955 RepID=UPI0025FB858C|nr:aminotransferase class V-fold PLP-dependent enzyme [Natronospirillum sp.]MCH8550545.1 aminotransferase class V-fold PLP-dependent enzyme [Natronospirillum sp.]
MRKPVYLDYAATTPVDPAVAERMAECLTLEGRFANPASRSHLYGWQAEEAVELARLQVAELINAEGRELVWTSGATESDNLALKGMMQASGSGHLVVSAIEHKAVLDAADWLEKQGYAVTRLTPDSTGQISVDSVAAALRDDTRLVSIMQVNNEVGTLNDVAAIGALCRDRGVAFHVDAVQAAGRVAIDVQAMNIDLLSLSAHKMYGPKGIGVLYVRRGLSPRPAAQIHGGGHEQGLRSGTLATHQCVGMGAAAELARQRLVNEPAAIAALRDRLWDGIRDLPGVRLNGHPEYRSCSHLNVGFAGQDGETLLMALRELAVSTGSACTSATLEPSFVLRAMGVPDALAHSSLRFSLGRFTTEEEIDHAIGHVCQVVTSLSQATA